MPIRPQWLRDICSIIFSIYYIIYANEADEKVRFKSIIIHCTNINAVLASQIPRCAHC